MRRLFAFILEILQMVVLAVIVVLPIRYFIFQPFLVQGQCMEPNFENRDYLIIDEISFRFREPKRGEVIVFKYPKNPSQRFIKRIVGLPGETIEIKDGGVIVSQNDKSQVLDESFYLSENIFTAGNLKITLAENEYFVLGDNRGVAFDSRNWGPLPRKNIIGRVIFRLWPITALAKIEPPNY